MKIAKKIKRLFSIYNLAILVSIIIILISLYIIFMPNEKNTTPSGLEVEQSNIEKGKEITENQARKIAVKQFKKLKENVKEEELNVVKIQRENEEYYYITSTNNSMEIKIDGGKITRINAALVEEK